MTQEAVVTKLLPGGMAQVAVTRSTACGGNCGHCESCIFQSELKAVARNRIGAQPGQQVIIESQSSRVFRAAALVYLLPLALFVVGYLLAALAGAGEGLRIAVSFGSLVLSGGILVWSQRPRQGREANSFDIVKLDRRELSE